VTAYDEAYEAHGRPRPHAAAALAAVARRDPAALTASVQARLAAAGVGFSSVNGGHAFWVDPVPRVLSAGEWAQLEAGLAQRVRALNAFVADAYGARRIVAEGVVPARVLDGAEYHEPTLAGMRPPGGIWIGVAGLDLVRDPSGEFLVLEDNLRTPSGIAYAMAARAAVAAELELTPGAAPRPLDDAPELLGWALRAAAPDGVEDPVIALVTEGEANPAHWEQRRLAERLGVRLTAPEELEHRGERLAVRGGPALDVVYRRTNADRLATPVGRRLEGPWRAGTLGLVNAFGTGVADDKLTHAYVEDMVRFYLGEEPALRSVPTLDLGDPATLERALDTLETLVVKPRGGHGGVGVVVCAHARRADLDRLRAALAAAPDGYVAQELVTLSTHPTVTEDGLAPRHVDLRPFTFLGRDGEVRVLPGGLTRVARGAGALVVNSSQDGGAKDTWVLA